MVPVFVGMRPAEKQSDAVGAIIAPEGGKLLAGCKQTVTVYVIDANRMPLHTQFTVINRAKGDEPVCSGETSDAGLATFQLTPAPGDSLAVQVRKGSTISTFAIPVDAHGVALQATIRRSRVYCKALSTAGAHCPTAPGCGLITLILASNPLRSMLRVWAWLTLKVAHRACSHFGSPMMD